MIATAMYVGIPEQGRLGARLRPRTGEAGSKTTFQTRGGWEQDYVPDQGRLGARLRPRPGEAGSKTTYTMYLLLMLLEHSLPEGFIGCDGGRVLAKGGERYTPPDTNHLA